jgi:ligand-binding sensor domain-containing protein
VQAVAAASDGSVWVGTTDGLHRFAKVFAVQAVDSSIVPGLRVEARSR